MNKSTVNLKLSKKQVKANVEHRGGFFGALIGLASRFLPTLLGGLATGLISGGVEKAVSGRGDGDGLYLYRINKLEVLKMVSLSNMVDPAI